MLSDTPIPVRRTARIWVMATSAITALVLVATACADNDTTPTSAPTTSSIMTSTSETNSLPDGSGCTPDTDELSDGRWFGYVSAVADTELEFDLACWFTGEAAVLASAEDGEESPPPNDYYVRNLNDQLRTVTISIGAEVTWLPEVGDPTSEATVLYPEWVVGRAQRGIELQPGVWVTIQNGEANLLAEQFVP